MGNLEKAAFDLAQKNTSQIGDLSTNKAEKTYVDTELAKKTTKTYVDQQITNIGSGSPKGTFATLTDLQTAYPSGTTGIYIVQADGKWYYWGGSAWTEGGVYQSSGIAKGSVSPENLSFLNVMRSNLFNKATIVSGYTMDGSGNLVANATFYVSDYIPVSPSTTYYYSSNGSNYALFKADKTFISRSAYQASPIVTDANTAFVRIISPLSSINSQFVSLTNSYSDYNTPYTTITDNGLKGSLLGIIRNDVQESNLFDRTTVTNGYAINSDGTLLASSPSNVSDFIKVVPNTLYYLNGANNSHVAEYDMNKNFIKRSNWGITSLTVSQATYFIKVSSYTTNLNTMFFSTQNQYVANNGSKIDSAVKLINVKTNNNIPIITLVDDDGQTAFNTKLKPVLDKYGYKSSLAIITDKVGTTGYLSLTELQTLQAAGHKMLSHSANHDPNLYQRTNDLSAVTQQQYLDDMQKSYDFLKNNGLQTNAIVYPYGHFTYSDYANQVTKAAREVYDFGLNIEDGIMTDEILDSYMYKGTFIKDSNGLSYYQGLIDQCISSKGWLILRSHAWIDSDLTGAFYDSVLAYIQSKGSAVSVMEFSDANAIKKNIVSIGNFNRKSGRLYVGRNGLLLNN